MKTLKKAIDHVINVADSHHGLNDELRESMRLVAKSAVIIENVKAEVSSIPKIVCLCGSTRFKDAFIEANKNETLKGKVVLSVGLFGHVEGLDMTSKTKLDLDELHLRKIDMSDEVLVLNVGGYIGSSTANEIVYAKANNKMISYLEC